MKKKIIIGTLSIVVFLGLIGICKFKEYNNDLLSNDCKKILGDKNKKYSDFYQLSSIRDETVEQVFRESDITKDLMQKYLDKYGTIEVKKSIQEFTSKVIAKSEKYKNGYIEKYNNYYELMEFSDELETFLQSYFKDKRTLEEIRK